MTWDPEQYLQFKKDRLRPAEELLNRIPIEEPAQILDLGCGPATSTRILGQRFPGARLLGLDNSEAMIIQAKTEYPDAEYLVADAVDWVSEQQHGQRFDLVFSNAVFHWLPDHEQLISKLAKNMSASSALAVQMPDNMGEPSHQSILKLVEPGGFGEQAREQMSVRHEVASKNDYYNWLQRDFTRVDIWQTTYSHVLPGHQQIVEWMKGAALTPVLSVLDEGEQQRFLEEYLELISQSYPIQEDGNVLFHFPRLFFVASR